MESEEPSQRALLDNWLKENEAVFSEGSLAYSGGYRESAWPFSRRDNQRVIQ